MGKRTFDRVYVWEAPVRLYHWLTVASMVALVSTGWILGDPPALLSGAEASRLNWFGIVRGVHFGAGFVFFFAFLIRVYWMFAGNRYARWHNFLPVTPKRLKKHVREIGDVLRVDILQLRKEPIDYIGHNALAATSYSIIFAATLFEAATGFALYAPMSQSALPQFFTWIVPLMGGDANVRLWHHLVMWVFVVFTLVHVHLAIFHDVTEGKGEISSIFSGSRFVEQRKE